jgi:Spy/CpxP family protein refolding chaperone
VFPPAAKRRFRDDSEWLDDSKEADKKTAERKKVEEIHKKLDAKILAVLTDEQKTKWREMNGKPFTGPQMIGGW